MRTWRSLAQPPRPRSCPLIRLSVPVKCQRSLGLKEFSILSDVLENTNLATIFVRPFPLIIYPAVIFAFLCYAVSLAWLVAINILNSFVLQAPPHNWKPSINGLINIPGLLGNLIGAWIGGWVIDRYSNWRSKKHGGVFQPKTRLHLLIIPALLVPAGCLAFGYGVAEQLNWTSLYVHPLRRAPVYAELLCSFFGYGLVTVGLIAVPVAAMTYVSDICLAVNADALLIVNALKNTVAFDFLYGVRPWVTDWLCQLLRHTCWAICDCFAVRAAACVLRAEGETRHSGVEAHLISLVRRMVMVYLVLVMLNA